MLTHIEINEAKMYAKLDCTPWQRRRLVALYIKLNTEGVHLISISREVIIDRNNELYNTAKEHFLNN